MKGVGPWEEVAAYAPSVDLEALERYAGEIERWNRAIRLVGPKDLEGIRAQIADALVPFLLHPPRFPLLDIGSGAGLPGIPVAIAFGGARVVCLEPLGKRVSFLRHAVRALGLKGTEVVEGRAGEHGVEVEDMIGAFATVTGRAVADPEAFLALAGPFLGEGGRVVVLRAGVGAPEVGGWRLAADVAYAGLEGLGPRSVATYERLVGAGGAA